MSNPNNGFPPFTPGYIPSGFYVPQLQVNGSTGTSQYPPLNAVQSHSFPSSSIQMWQHQQQYQGYHMGSTNYIYNGSQVNMSQASVPPTYFAQQPSQQPICYTSHNYPPTVVPQTQPQNYYQQPLHAKITSPPPPPPPPAPKEEFRCPPCNLVLDSAPALRAHTATHIKCDKCSFTAVPKAVKSHYSAVHGQYSGNGFKSVSIAVPGSKKVQRFQICVGNHPDDIQRWIAERRKRFPRKSNKQQPQQPTTAQSIKNNSSPNETITAKHESALLGSLLAGYGSSSDEEKDGNDYDEATNKLESSGTTSNLPESNSLPKACHVLPEDGAGRNQPQRSQQLQHRTRDRKSVV